MSSEHLTPKQQNIAHEIFSRVDHILKHKVSFNKFKKIEITSSIFCDHHGRKLEISHKRKAEKHEVMEAI